MIKVCCLYTDQYVFLVRGARLFEMQGNKIHNTFHQCIKEEQTKLIVCVAFASGTQVLIPS